MFYKSGHSSGGVGPSKLKTFSTLGLLVTLVYAKCHLLQSLGRPKLSILVAKNGLMAKFEAHRTRQWMVGGRPKLYQSCMGM